MPETKNDAEQRLMRLTSAMAEIDPDFVGFMGEVMGMFRASPYDLETSRYVFGPLIFHVAHPTTTGRLQPYQDCGWLSGDLIREWSPQARKERIEIANGQRPDLVSPTELWMVMYNATCDSPLRYPLTDIYCWAVHRSMKASGLRDVKKLERHADRIHVIPDTHIFGPGEHWAHAHEYRELARVIRDKVSSASKYRVGRPHKFSVELNEVVAAPYGDDLALAAE